MHLIDGHRRAQPGLTRPTLDPSGIGPGKVALGLHDGGGLGAQLEAPPVGIGLEMDHAAGGTDLELVDPARRQVGDEELPDPVAVDPHGVGAPVPGVEVAHHADPPRIGRPHREQDAGDAVGLVDPSTQHPVGVPVAPLAEEMQVEVRELVGEAVGVVADVLPVLPIPPDQPVTLRHRLRRAAPLEEVGALDPGHRMPALGEGDRLRLGIHHAHHDTVPLRVPAEHGEGISMGGGDDLLEGLWEFGSIHPGYLGRMGRSKGQAQLCALSNGDVRADDRNRTRGGPVTHSRGLVGGGDQDSSCRQDRLAATEGARPARLLGRRPSPTPEPALEHRPSWGFAAFIACGTTRLPALRRPVWCRYRPPRRHRGRGADGAAGAHVIRAVPRVAPRWVASPRDAHPGSSWRCSSCRLGPCFE